MADVNLRVNEAVDLKLPLSLFRLERGANAFKKSRSQAMADDVIPSWSCASPNTRGPKIDDAASNSLSPRRTPFDATHYIGPDEFIEPNDGAYLPRSVGGRLSLSTFGLSLAIDNTTLNDSGLKLIGTATAVTDGFEARQVLRASAITNVTLPSEIYITFQIIYMRYSFICTGATTGREIISTESAIQMDDVYFTLEILPERTAPPPPTRTAPDWGTNNSRTDTYEERSTIDFTLPSPGGNPAATITSTTLPAGISLTGLRVHGSLTDDISSQVTGSVTFTASNGVSPNDTYTWNYTINPLSMLCLLYRPQKVKQVNYVLYQCWCKG